MLDDPNTLKEQAYLGENFDHFDKFVKLHHEGIAVAEESDEVKRDKGDEEGDTVSAIAMDKEGYLACANSTGKNENANIDDFARRGQFVFIRDVVNTFCREY